MQRQKSKTTLTQINTIDDIDPRRVESIKKWFIGIKVFDGKKQNTIAYDKKTFSQAETLEVVRETHKEWKDLLSSEDPKRAKKRE